MKSIKFPQANCELAKDQPEYETLHVFAEMKQTEKHGFGDNVDRKNIPWSMTACFELNEEEIAEIVRTKRIWHTQMLFGNNFQPIRMSTQNPFE